MRGNSYSFSGGEVTPEFWGQIGDAKFRTGLATCRNFRVLPHGPVQNRAGFEFVREVKDSSKAVRLLPFTYSSTQTMVIEAGAGYCRYHTQGATILNGAVPYETATPYAAADLFGLRYTQSADVMSLVHTGYAPAELKRTAPGGVFTMTYAAISFATSLVAPTGLSAAATVPTTHGTPTTHRYAATTVGADGIDESAISAEVLGTTPIANISAATNANPGVFTTAADHGLAVGDVVDVAAIVGMTGANQAGLTVASTPSTTTLTLSLNGTPLDTSAMGAYVSGGTITLHGVKNNLFDTGAFNVITFTPAAVGKRTNVYKWSNGLWAYLGQANGTTFTDDNITPDLSKTAPEPNNPFSGPGEYPGAVSYFEQRRWFAGSINKPQTMWATKSGTESNMAYSIPTRDTDALTFRVVAREANLVRHLVPMSSLVALTSSAEWRVTAVNSDAITPTSINVKPQSGIGADDATPAVVNTNVIYATARGGHVREMAYSWQQGGYMTGDLSMRAPHLFDGWSLVDIAHSKAPYPIVYFVSSNGRMLSLTYVPEQNVGAWAWHDTDGAFESVCCVAEGAEDVLYAVVRRTVMGQTKRYIERMRPRAWVTPADAFHVDAGLTYSGAATSTISGLGHLEGKTVSILADGAVQPPRAVSGGTITLDTAASKVHVGLPYLSDMQTLPLALHNEAGFGQGRPKNVNKVFLRVFKSSGIKAGPSFERLVEAKQRSTEAYGTPPGLKTDEIEIVVEPSWQQGGQVCVRQSDPLPLTVVSMTLDTSIAG